MIEPINRDVKLFKNATFKLEFRIKEDGATVDLTGWSFYFKAVEDCAGGDTVLETNSVDSPAGITIDSTKDSLITVEISAADTDAITQKGRLYFEIDAVTNTGERQRRWIGKIDIIEHA